MFCLLVDLGLLHLLLYFLNLLRNTQTPRLRHSLVLYGFLYPLRYVERILTRETLSWLKGLVGSLATVRSHLTALKTHHVAQRVSTELPLSPTIITVPRHGHNIVVRDSRGTDQFFPSANLPRCES